MTFTFESAKSIHFGAGVISDLGSFAARLCGAHVFFVCDPGMVELGLADRACAPLEAAGVKVTRFPDVVADPPESVIMAAVAQMRACGAGGVIGFGGGSSLDVAKLVALLAAGGENLADIYGIGQAKGPRAPLILVPTTSGTGSEVTPISIVTTGAHEKMGVVSPHLLPDLALLDPELTYGLPPMITAATGVDAMVHAIESYASTNANNNPISQNLAIQALRLMEPALLRAVHHGDDAKARGDMMLGAMLAGQAFANAPVAAVHALAYPLGGHYGIPHGLSNALVLPHVLRFNCATHPGPYAALASHMFPDLTPLAEIPRAIAFCNRLAQLCVDCGLPSGLGALNIPRDELPDLARDAMNQTRLLKNNPRPVTQTDALAIYEAAF